MNTIRWILLNSTTVYAPLGANDNDDDDEDDDDKFYPYHIQCMLYNTYIFFFFSLDNVTLHLDGVLYLRVTDPFKVCFFFV